MDPSSLFFFKLNYEEEGYKNAFQSKNDPFIDIATSVENNFKNFMEQESRQKKLMSKVDRRSISLFESGLLEQRLQAFAKQCGQDRSQETDQIFDKICQSYWTFIQVRGDGNCFYRAFMLSYILKIAMHPSTQPLRELIKRVLSLKELKYIIQSSEEEVIDLEKFSSREFQHESSETLEVKENEENSNFRQTQEALSNKKYQNDQSFTESLMNNNEQQQENHVLVLNEEMQVLTLGFLLQLLYQKERKNSFEVSHLLEYYNSTPELDISMIIICKNILLTEYEKMQQDSSCKDFIDDSMTKEISNILINYGESAQDLVFFLAAKAFKCEVEVQNIYYKPENTLIHNLLTFNSDEQNLQLQQKEEKEEGNESKIQNNDSEQKINISVWYTGGHYDILFDQKFSEEHMSFCFSEPKIYQSSMQQQKSSNYLKGNESPQFHQDNTVDTIYKQDKDDKKCFSDERLTFPTENTQNYDIQSQRNFSPTHTQNENEFHLDNLIQKYTVGSTLDNNDKGEYPLFDLDIKDSQDEKIQQINNMIKKSVCFFCSESQQYFLNIIFDDMPELICRECFISQYNSYKLEDNSCYILSIEQMQSCLQEIVTQNTQNNQCTSCSVKLNKNMSYQQLDLINLQTGLPIKVSPQHLIQDEDKTQQIILEQEIKDKLSNVNYPNEEEEIEEAKKELGDWNLDKPIEEPLKLEKQTTSLSYDKKKEISYCLFCTDCLERQLLNQNNILQKGNYSLYVQSIQGEVEFGYNKSIHADLLKKVYKQCLDINEEFKKELICNYCKSESYEIDMPLFNNILSEISEENDNVKERLSMKVRICCCLSFAQIEKKNPIYDQFIQQFLQTQNFFSYLEFQMSKEDQCLVCNYGKQEYLEQMQIQNNPTTQKEFFEFYILNKKLCLCPTCSCKTEIFTPQSISIVPKDYSCYLNLYIGQKQTFNLHKYVWQCCHICHQQNPNQIQNPLQKFLQLQSLQQGLYCCHKCQQKQQYQQQYQQQPFSKQDNFNNNDLFYHDNNNLHNEQELLSMQNLPSQSSLDNLNRKRPFDSSFGEDRVLSCQSCRFESINFSNQQQFYENGLCEKCLYKFTQFDDQTGI